MPRRTSMVIRAMVTVALGAALLTACADDTPEGDVHILEVDGVIGPVIANYVERGIGDAEQAAAVAVVIRLDTPGGLDSSMREIIQRINGATVPVVVYVSPSGGRAASAGTFITMAAHVAAMAPNTAIGAAHPVAAGGEDIQGDARAKAENDAAAYIRSIAQARGRNADWAERAVRESVSASASEAVELDVVDFQAEDLDALLTEIDDREVALGGGAVTVETEGAEQYVNGMSFVERFLLVISDPNIAFLLLSIGSLAIIVELFNPTGIGVVVGLFALIVAFFSLGTLPVNWAGAGLVLLGVGLLTAELFIASGGILGLAGVVVMMFGGLFFTTSSNPEFEVSRWLVFGVPGVFGALFAALAVLLIRGRRQAVRVGDEAMVGLTGVVETPVTREGGYISVRGERWRARLDEAAHRDVLQPDERVEVTSAMGLRLTVRPLTQDAGAAGGGESAATDAGGETQLSPPSPET